MRYLYDKYSWVDLLLPVTLLTFIFVIIFHRRTFYLMWQYPKCTSFTYVPFFGHIGLFKYINPSKEDFVTIVELLLNESGKLLHFLNYKFIGIYKADQLEVIMTHPNSQKRHLIFDFLEGYVGDSILRIGGEHWKRNRKALTPVMHSETIASYTEDVCKHAEVLADILKDKVGETFNAMPYIFRCIIDELMEVSAGINLEAQTKGTKIDHYTDLLLELAMYRSASVVKHPEFIYKWTNDYKLQQEALEYMNAITDKIFDERKKVYAEEMEESEAPVVERNVRQGKIIDNLLDLNNDSKLTDYETRSEFKSLLVAAYDTTTSGVSFTLLALAMSQALQEKVYEEVIDVLGPDRRAEYKDLSKMVYLEMCIKESLRLFPPIPRIPREAEDEFSMNGHIVPKGTQLLCNILETHRSPLYWKDPLKFDPERWTPEGVAKQVKYSYLPFVIGPHTCFGTKLAKLTLKSTIATLIRRYKIFTPYKTIEDINLDIKVTIKAKNGILLRFEERNQL